MILQLSQIDNQPYKIICIPLLIENINNYPFIDAILTIETNIDIQISRIMARDNIDKSLAEKIMQSQLTSKERMNAAHHTIINDTSLTQFKYQVENFHNKLIKQLNCKKN